MLSPRNPIFLIDPQELLSFPQIRDKEWTLPVLIPETAIYRNNRLAYRHHIHSTTQNWQNSYRKKICTQNIRLNKAI